MHCLEVDNRGMDIAPFFSAITACALKPASSGSSSNPHEEIAAELRLTPRATLARGLLEGLLGNRCNVKRIQQRFACDRRLTLLAPASFLMLQQRDRSVAANDAWSTLC